MEEKETTQTSLEEIVSPTNKQYIMNIVKIESTTIKEIFIPWQEVVFAEVNYSIDDVENILITSRHTRLPVTKSGEVIGIINSKEFLAFKKTGHSNWMSLRRAAVSIQENTTLLTALRYLQAKRAHMAVVYDGSKRTGIVTMEAIFEEIIGDIYDEDDDGAIEKILSTVRYRHRN